MTVILGIESSCDDTSAAILKDMMGYIDISPEPISQDGSTLRANRISLSMALDDLQACVPVVIDVYKRQGNRPAAGHVRGAGLRRTILHALRAGQGGKSRRMAHGAPGLSLIHI